jgi:lysyl-tRNA synthetase class 2
MHPSDFLPSASLAALRRRAELLQAVRGFFDSRGFWEVETPVLSHDVVVDRHLDPLGVILPHDVRRPAEGERLWLQTSPEFGMKRLLAAGATAIYQVTRAFRGGEVGPRHNPEFTIVEWYRVGDDYEAGMRLLSELVERVLGTPPAERLTYREAFRRYAGIDPFESGWTGGGGQSPPSGDFELDYVLTTQVEPRLGVDRPTILHDYPAEQAALARVRGGEMPVAERFELYYRGVELANGYHELLDAAALRQRNSRNNVLRRADGKPELPEESRLLAAMEHGLPPCSGCALGFDRLVMVAIGASSLAEVMAFPVERA